MIYLPITRSWMVSRRAQKIYFSCALAPMWLFGLVVVGAMGLTSDMERSTYWTVASVIRFFVWPGVFGTAVLAVGMWYFWYGFYEAAWYKKALWFLVLWFSMLLGPVLYYFFVYRRSPVLIRN